MKTFIIRFKQTVELEYTSTIHAKSEDEAISNFDDDPFFGVDNDQEPDDEQGLSIEILSIEEEQEDNFLGDCGS
jgi:hypothetical protein